MKSGGFIVIFLAVALLAGTLVTFRDTIFGSGEPVKPYVPQPRTGPPAIHYYRDDHTGVCFAELTTTGGYCSLKLTAVDCNAHILDLIEPWPTWYTNR